MPEERWRFDGIGRELATSASRRTFLKGTDAMVVSGGLAASGVEAASGDSRVVGYYPSYAGSYTPSDVPFDKLTHLNFAFLDVASDGTVSVGSSTASTSSNFDVKHHMQYWASKPIAKGKLVMGMPFYGRSYSGVASDNDGLYNSFDSSSSVTYYDIQQNIEPQSDYVYHWHSTAQVPWLYSSAENTFVSYDDAASIGNKSDFVKNNG